MSLTDRSGCDCVIDSETLRCAQCDDAEIQAIVLMHDRGKCPNEHRDEYVREVVMIRGYGMPRCGVVGGDGSIPGPVCMLPAGHGAMGYEPHYG